MGVLDIAADWDAHGDTGNFDSGRLELLREIGRRHPTQTWFWLEWVLAAANSLFLKGLAGIVRPAFRVRIARNELTD